MMTLMPASRHFWTAPGTAGRGGSIMATRPEKLRPSSGTLHSSPCVSNWKNSKGYTIPLEKRLQADGRGLQDATINDKFAALSEDLYLSERKAREEIKIRNDMVKNRKAREEELRERQLQDMAKQAREAKEDINSYRPQEGETADRKSVV